MQEKDPAKATTKLDPIGIICALLGAAFFSLKPVLIKLLYAEGVPTDVVIVWRMLMSAPIYVIIGYLVYRSRKGEVKFTPLLILQTCILGIIGYYIATYLDLLGIHYISAQLERIILFTYPTFVAILGYLVYREKISLKQFASMILAYAGIAIMFGNELNVTGDDALKGGLLVLAAAFTFACYMLFQKSSIEIMGSRMFTSIAMVAASLAIFVHGALSSGLEFLDVSNYVLWLSFVTAIIGTVIPSYLLAEAVNRIGSGPTSISIGIGPLFTSIFAVLTLGESFTIYHLIGTILVILGIYLLSQVKK
ncbi:MAG: EamA family transporter [Hyphomicrobiales bacterium]|nr:MAG: EamA family transporter [Hyphomicrobiales bacterium]